MKITTIHREVGYLPNIEIIETALREKLGIDDNSFVLRALAAHIWSNRKAAVNFEVHWTTDDVALAIANVRARVDLIAKQLDSVVAYTSAKEGK